MEPNPIMIEKMAKIASMLGVSTDTISKMTDEASKSKPEMTVTKVAVAVEPKEEEYPLEKITDEQINSMNEQEAKDFIKKTRDSYKKGDMEEEKKEEEPIVEIKKESNASRLSKMPDMSRVMGK